MLSNWRASGLLFVFGNLWVVPAVAALAAPANVTTGWPRMPPKDVIWTCYDRDTRDMQKMVIAQVNECDQSQASLTPARTRINQLVAEPQTIAPPEGANMFRINFTCQGAPEDTCAKAKAGFEQAGEAISSALALRSAVVVNAKFQDLGNPAILGSAATKRFHVMADRDGVNRLYPQALVKQLRPSIKNQAEFDIVAEFNAGAKFWFEGEGPIGADQHDFAYVVLHELVHGLGFASSWRDYFNLGILTPLPQMDPSAKAGEQEVKQFQEFAFDRFLFDTERNAPLGLTARLIRSTVRGGGAKANGTAGTSESTTGDLAIGAASPKNLQSVVGGAAGLAEARRLFTLAQTSNSMMFVLPGAQGGLVLETGLRPYNPGSSVSHVDAASVKDSEDFLMRHSLEPGKSLREMVENTASGGSFGPMGPRLLKLMGALGYTIRSEPGIAIRDRSVTVSSAACQARSSFIVPLAAVCLAIWMTMHPPV